MRYAFTDSKLLALASTEWPLTRGQFIFAVVLLAAVIILPRLLFDRAAVGPHDDPALAEFFESVTPYLDREQPTTRIVDFERLFAAVYARVMRDYVDQPDEWLLIDGAISGVMDLSPIPEGEPAERLAEAAIEGMLATLDPHSTLLSAEAFREMVKALGE